MSVDITQFHQIFFEESVENIDAMENQLMALDPQRLEDEVINSIFRAAHSIKGGAGTFGFAEIADFTHLLETLLDEVRAGQRSINQEEIDLFLQAVDCLRDLIHCCQQKIPYDQDRVADLSAQFQCLLGKTDASKTEHPNQAAEAQANRNDHWHIYFKPHTDLLTTGNEPLRIFRALVEEAKLKVTANCDQLPEFEALIPEHCYLSWNLELEGPISKDKIEENFEWVLDQADVDIQAMTSIESSPANTGWRIQFVPNENIFLTGNDPLRLLRELEELGEPRLQVKTDRLPEFENYHPDQCYLRWDIELTSAHDQPAIEQVFEWVREESQLTIQKFDTASSNIKELTASENSDALKSQAAPVKNTVGASKPPAKMESSSIRVGIDKIDSLINMVGELVITQSMLGQIGGDFAMDKLPRLLEGLSQLEHNTRELQESVMRIRMLPISFAFSRFPRMVRDLSRRMNKQIELEMRGEQTELDKTVMERIGDPLVHLVRNAVDHGIESPDERKRQGKSASGTILLNAYHQSGNVVIEIQDDGRGIDREKLLDKASKQNLLPHGDRASLGDNQVFDLIFHPGLSTAAEVSDVSGRGVGMDVVKRNIQELNGNIEVKSQPGTGTTITVRLPLTLAILDGQLVRVGDSIYIFPLVSIVESMQVKPEDLNQVAGGCDVFQLRNEYIPVVRLYEIFNAVPDSTRIEDSLLVVVEGDGEKIGVVVDELAAQQQVVIKSLEENYQRIEGVSGATILGDGTVSLILDIPGLVKLAGHFQLTAQQTFRPRAALAAQASN